MAINTIGVGTTAEDNTGDTPRTGIMKHNANFTDPANAAARLMQTSPTDTAAGRVMAVGAFGLGGTAVSVDAVSADTLTDGANYYLTNGINTPEAGTWMIRGSVVSVGRGYQEAHSVNLATVNSFERFQNGGTWSAWQPVYTGANYQPEINDGMNVAQLMYNNTGGSVGNGASIAGPSLRFTYFTGGVPSPVGVASGTWKNVGGATYADNEFFLATKVSN